MVNPISNNAASGISDIFEYLDGLVNRIPGRPIVKFGPIPESLARVQLGSEVNWKITKALSDAVQNGQKYFDAAKPLAEREVEVTVSSARNGRAIFSVADNGRGMSFLQRHLYGKVSLRNLAAAAEGTISRGLGAKRIAELVKSLKGGLAVSANAGGGTVVRVTVPLSVEGTTVHWWTSATRVFNSAETATVVTGATKTFVKGATVFLLVVETVPAVIESTYNYFDDPCDVFAREAWYVAASNYSIQAGIFGDIPAVPWYERVGNSMQSMANMVMPSALTKFAATIDPFDDTAKNWIDAKARACRSVNESLR